MVNYGDVAAQAQIQQIQNPVFKVTGGEMSMLGGLMYLVGGQDFEGQYNPGGTTGFSQTYIDEIQAFNINYNGQVASSLSITNYQAQNDQVNLRRRDYSLGNVVLPNGQPALEIFGGVFTPGPGTLATQGVAYRNPILISGIGEMQVLPYQQTFNQYSAPHIGLFDPSTGSMDTIFLGRYQPRLPQLCDGTTHTSSVQLFALPGRFAFRQRRDHPRPAGKRVHTGIRNGEPVAGPGRRGSAFLCRRRTAPIRRRRL